MSNAMRYARRGRPDANHRVITAALEAVGCSVLDTSKLGGGKPDAVAFRIQPGGRLGVWCFEFKVETGKVRDSQTAFAKTFCAPVYVVRSAAEAVRIVAADWRDGR